jgi:hypothetical protein
MAYGLKYQSEFYNVFKKLVQVQIAKDGYVGAVTDLRTTEVTIEVNFQGITTPVVGTGAKVVVLNTSTFTSLDDLLTSLEKQFICTIIYDNITVFKGFSICDLNEQNFHQNASIVLQFTDYLRRLDGHKLTCINNLSLQSTIYDIIAEVRTVIGLHSNLYVNSTLFEENMINDVHDTFLEQTYVENSIFYIDSVNYEDTYTVLNKVLKSFGVFLYSCGDKWALERLGDMNRTGTWVVFGATAIGSSTASLRSIYNKQSHFNYTDLRQKIAYDSGLKTLILNLKEKIFDSIIFNDYDPVKMESVSDETPDPGTIGLRSWHYYELLTGLKQGFNWMGMNSYLRWYTPDHSLDGENYGIYNAFEVQFNHSVEEPAMLNISYSMGVGGINLASYDEVDLRFSIRVDGGPLSGQYLHEFELNDDNKTIIPTVDADQISLSETFKIEKLSQKSWKISKSLNLTDQWLNTSTNTVHASVWEKLGSPAKQKFIIMFWPVKMRADNSLSTYSRLADVNFLGDVSINITQGEIVNRLTYSVNQNFIKTEEIDMDLFDFDNVNFTNGLAYNVGSAELELQKTKLWISREIVESENPASLMDIYAMVKFRDNYRTMHKLQGSIMYDGYIKPFSILTDDNLKNENQENRQFLLPSYIWDLNNGVYDINTIEYTDEEVSLDEILGTLKTPPTITTCNQPVAGGHLYIEWSEVDGADGYILQRKPQWYGSPSGGDPYWAQYWETIYSGPLAYKVDDIQEQGTAEDQMQVSYRVCAFNKNVNGVYSAEVIGVWEA